jgi:membrane protein
LWSANSGIKALFDALNAVYEEKEKRGFTKLNAVTLAFTIGTTGFLLIAVACVVALPVVLNYFPAAGVSGLLLTIARWPILLVLVAFGFTLIYRFGPSRRSQPRWQSITWGSALAAILWLAASALFSWYAANFGNFNKTYGSLGAIIGFMTWMWLSIIVVLMGAKLNAELEHQTTCAAEMADTSGPS